MLETILHTIEHTILDCLKLLPFLLVAFLIIEFIEHKLSKTNETKLQKAGKLGPLLGSLLGAIPQCGFSVLATNLYVTRIISLGTLISIYLSTSDEMLPILISNQASLSLILKVLLIKIAIGMFCGFIIDLIFRKTKNKKEEIKHLCEEEHCDCEHGIIRSAIKHTIHIWLFIIVITLILNLIMHFKGEELLRNIFYHNSFLSPFLASLVGLIPNCASSVLLTELYLNNILPFSSLIAGLLTGSGVAIIVLFKENHNLKENIFITLLIYLLGVTFGIFLELLTIFS